MPEIKQINLEQQNVCMQMIQKIQTICIYDYILFFRSFPCLYREKRHPPSLPVRCNMLFSIWFLHKKKKSFFPSLNARKRQITLHSAHIRKIKKLTRTTKKCVCIHWKKKIDWSDYWKGRSLLGHAF